MGHYILYRAFKQPTTQVAPTAAALVPLGVVGGFVDAAGGGGWGPLCRLCRAQDAGADAHDRHAIRRPGLPPAWGEGVRVGGGTCAECRPPKRTYPSSPRPPTLPHNGAHHPAWAAYRRTVVGCAGWEFVSSTGSSPAVWGRAIPVPPYSSKNRRPEAVSVSLF